MTALTRPVKRTATCAVPYGVNPSIVIALYPGGVIGLREARQRKEYQVAAGTLYGQLVAAEAEKQRRDRRRGRRGT
jgi:hypothetical protein